MRPKLNITPEQRQRIKTLASLGLNDSEIALVEGLNRRTLANRCQEELTQGRLALKIRLHKIQWALAEKSPTMAIFLGKQYLGQKDVPVPPDQQGTIIEYIQNVIVTTKFPPSAKQPNNDSSANIEPVRELPPAAAPAEFW